MEKGKPLYVQVSFKNISNILKIKENFPKLLNKKIEEINKTIFSKVDKLRPRINMMTKSPSRKQIIVSMSIDNANKFISVSSEHIANLNRSLRNTKTDLMVDFIYTDHQGLIVISNRVVSQSEISIVSTYIKNCSNIDTNDIQDTCLPQSKSYLSIPYIMKSFIKTSHIFDNINITSKLWVVKVSPKSNMAIV